MKLTANQIDQLYKFTRAHYVEHYDLQTELVDHLANGIEKRWESNPALSFDDALNLEFKEFGVFGFNDIIEKHSISMSKRYVKIIFGFMQEYIKLPKIIGTLCAILALFYTIRYVAASVWILGFLSIMGLFYFVMITSWHSLQYKKRKKKTGKRWKLEEMIFNTGTLGVFILNLFQLIYYSDILKIDHFAIQLLIALLIVFTIFLTHICVKVLPEKAEELLHKTYPEYELLK